jgi:MarR family transcriptional repressor of mepA
LNPNKRITFILRDIHNQIRQVIHKSSPRFEKGPRSQLQGGILGYLYHHGDQPVYQKDLEKEFRISRATASNTLQVMEREGLIVRKALDKDARLKRIRLTEEAYQNHRQIEAQMELIEARMTGGLSEAEVEELRRLLGIAMRNLEEMAAECEALPTREDSVPEPCVQSGKMGTESGAGRELSGACETAGKQDAGARESALWQDKQEPEGRASP